MTGASGEEQVQRLKSRIGWTLDAANGEAIAFERDRSDSVMAGLDPAIHASLRHRRRRVKIGASIDFGAVGGGLVAWMAGSSPAMTSLFGQP